MHSLSEIVLGLFILNLGTAFGAGLYETKIVIPLWFVKSSEGYRVSTKAMQEIETGRKFWGFVTTGPLTLLTFANLYYAWHAQPPVYGYWLAAALLSLFERIGTFSFFIPTALRLQRADEWPSAKAARLASLWIGFNYVRNALTLIAWLLALRTFSL
ncbi:MAG: DUF1772 domain-containing protein [Spirosomataceae bacterium]